MSDDKTRILGEDLSTDDHAAENAAQDVVSSGDVFPGFDRVHFSQGETIFEENDNADAAYLIVRGHVEVRKGMHSTSPQTLGKLGRGDIFGELAMFDDSPRTAQALARSNVEAIRISRGEFLKRLSSVDPVMKAIILYMVKRVRAASDDKVRKHEPNWTNWSKDT